MITRRSLLLFGFLVLLSGCYHDLGCVAPNLVSPDPLLHCYYQFQVIGIHTAENTTFIEVKVPETLYDGERGEEFRTPNPGQTYTLPVRSLATLGTPVKANDGKIYEVVRHGSSKEVELLGELIRKQKK